jgi:hypothetical protein
VFKPTVFILAVLVLGLVAAPARADDLADAKAFISKQVEPCAIALDVSTNTVLPSMGGA